MWETSVNNIWFTKVKYMCVTFRFTHNVIFRRNFIFKPKKMRVNVFF